MRFLMWHVAAMPSFSLPVTVEWVLDAHSAEKRVLIDLDVAQSIRAVTSKLV